MMALLVLEISCNHERFQRYKEIVQTRTSGGDIEGEITNVKVLIAQWRV